eukprot:gnl/TRDRNA2_/TRDRNA2_177267_c2_seq1.p1 gnl/TRDRNA2_/TRDRNA2_177267_c2~~gnl/TRDRNA2_/TRDRNA2_177267_c2_seq1.p1  ORF type:complete len:478 (+),score=130.08 gnl/TRDRNA2_/TRDRNA2_177267_c2_seq1:46-1479(+)
MSAFAGKGKSKHKGKEGKGRGKDKGVTADLEFDTADEAQAAIARCQGMLVRGAKINLRMDPQKVEGTKVLVSGLPKDVTPEEIQELFGGDEAVEEPELPEGAAEETGCEAPTAASKRPRDAAAAEEKTEEEEQPVKRPKKEKVLPYEVRFTAPQAALAACEELDGAELQGYRINVTADARNWSGTSIHVYGLPEDVDRIAVKDFFAAVGKVAFASWMKPKGEGRGGFFAKGPVGLVRYFDAAVVPKAVKKLNGKWYGEHQLDAQAAPDESEAMHIRGLPSETENRDIRDLGEIGGEVKFAIMLYPKRKENASQDAAPKTRGVRRMVATVRFADAAHAALAVKRMNGSVLGGRKLCVSLDPKSFDGTKILAEPIDVTKQEVKDHFASIGPVAHAVVKSTFGQPQDLDEEWGDEAEEWWGEEEWAEEVPTAKPKKKKVGTSATTSTKKKKKVTVETEWDEWGEEWNEADGWEDSEWPAE